MQVKQIIPTTPEFLREALIVMGGALLAALVLSKLPSVRKFIAENVGGSISKAGCDCTDK